MKLMGGKTVRDHEIQLHFDSGSKGMERNCIVAD